MSQAKKAANRATLDAWKSQSIALDGLMDDIQKSPFGLDTNGQMFEVMYRLFDAYTEVVAALVGDQSDWLHWFCYENDMGAKAAKAGFDGKLKRIRSIDDLLWLIDESNRRSGA